MLLEQANEMNQSFLRQNKLIDSLAYRVDTVESLYVQKKFVVFNDSIILNNYKSQVEYERSKNKIINKIFDTIIVSSLLVGFAVFVMINK